MTRAVFIEELTVHLKDNVLDTTLHEQISFYNEYIDVEKRKGRKEEEVLEELGDPKLIAKTIIQVHPGERKISSDADEIKKRNPYAKKETVNEDGSIYDERMEKEREYEQNAYEENNNQYSQNRKVYGMSGIGCFLFVLIFILIVWAISKLIVGAGIIVFSGLTAAFGPVVAGFILVALFIFLFSRPRR